MSATLLRSAPVIWGDLEDWLPSDLGLGVLAQWVADNHPDISVRPGEHSLSRNGAIELVDHSRPGTRVQRVGQALTFNGIDELLSIPHLVGTETVTSMFGTATPTVSAGQIDFTAGTAAKIELSNGDVFLCEEESGTTVYNTGNIGQNGTVTTGDIASMRQPDTGVTSSDANDTGYTESGAVLVPADPTNPGNDVLGGALTYDETAGRPAMLLGQPMLTFNGIDELLVVPHLVGTEVATNGGTATPTVSAGQIDFTAGTVFNLTIDDGSNYPCTEKSGTTVYNVDGTTNHATITSGDIVTMWANTQDEYDYLVQNGGGVRRWFGGNRYFDSGDDQSLSPSASFTLTCWVRHAEISTQAIMSKWFDLSQGEYLLWALSGKHRFQISDGASSSNVQWSSSLVADQWYFIEAYYNSNSELIGISVDDQAAQTSPHTTGLNSNNNSHLQIGRQAGNYMKGDMYQVTFYKRVLTAVERTWLYNAGAGRTRDEIDAHGSLGDYSEGWSLDEPSGDAISWSGNNNGVDNNNVGSVLVPGTPAADGLPNTFGPGQMVTGTVNREGPLGPLPWHSTVPAPLPTAEQVGDPTSTYFYRRDDGTTRDRMFTTTTDEDANPDVIDYTTP